MSETPIEDAPFALVDASEVARRRAMLSLPHVAPLVAYAESIKANRGHGCDLPLFDPCDGGINAKLLFLLEAPGPKAVGSTFISCNNPDQTAKNMNGLLREAKLPRRDYLLWNIVPWYVGDGNRIRAVVKNDVAEAMPYLADLLSLLPELRAITLVGKAAGSAAPMIKQISGLPIYFAPHPSPKVFNIYPMKRADALQAFSELRNHLDDAPQDSTSG